MPVAPSQALPAEWPALAAAPEGPEPALLSTGPDAVPPSPTASQPSAGSPRPGSPPAKSPGCLVGCGCGCVFPLLLAVLGAILFFWVLDPVLAGLRATPSLPEVPRPQREDRWNLADKLRGLTAPEPTGAAPSLDLTPGEANALLARWSPVPARGFAMVRASLIPGQNGAIILLQGSGFSMRSVSFVIEIAADTPGAVAYRVRRILVNGLETSPATGDWTWSLVRAHFETWVPRVLGWSLAELNGGRLRVMFAPDRITLAGDFTGLPLIKEAIAASAAGNR